MKQLITDTYKMKETNSLETGLNCLQFYGCKDLPKRKPKASVERKKSPVSPVIKIEDTISQLSINDEEGGSIEMFEGGYKSPKTKKLKVD